MTLTSPVWLVVLVLPLGLAALARRLARPRARALSSLTLLIGVPATWRVRLRHVPAALRWCTLALLAVAIASPVAHSWERRLRRAGLDVLLLVDVSQSMRARDVLPDRLTVARDLAAEMVRERPGDRIGLLLFAGDYALACPLTTDHRALSSRLASIEPTTSTGTALGTAILAGLQRLQVARAREGVIVVFTDGASNAGSLSGVEAARMAAASSVRVVTVAVGHSGVVPFPTEVGVLDVPVEVDEDALREVAENAEGLFVRAEGGGAIETVADALERLEPREETQEVVVTLPVGRWFGAMTVLLLVIELGFAGLCLRSWS